MNDMNIIIKRGSTGMALDKVPIVWVQPVRVPAAQPDNSQSGHNGLKIDLLDGLAKSGYPPSIPDNQITVYRGYNNCVSRGLKQFAFLQYKGDTSESFSDHCICQRV